MQKLNTLPFLYLLLLYDICNGLNLNIFQDEHGNISSFIIITYASKLTLFI